MRKFISVLFAVVLALSLSLVTAVPMAQTVEASPGTTWYVDGTQGTDNATQGTGTGADAFETIQYAIDAASDNDTIIVADGVYTEDVTIAIPLTLKSAGGSDNCTIDADGSDITVYITADGVIFGGTGVGFTVTGGSPFGVILDGINNCQILGNVVTENEYVGIFVTEGMSNNTIQGNEIYWNGEVGIYLDMAGGNYILENEIYENGDEEWYGIYLGQSDNNIIAGNEIYWEDYCVYLEGSDNNTIGEAVVNGEPIPGNTIYECFTAAVYLDTSNGNTVSVNTIYDASEGVYLDDAHYNEVSVNTIDDCGEGIYLYDSHFNTVEGNPISYCGDGIYLEGFDFDDEITGNMVTGNIISNVDNGIYLYYADTNFMLNNDISMFGNGGIYISDKCHNVVAGNIISNEGGPGGFGVYLEAGDGDTIGAATVDDEEIPGNIISWVEWGIYLAYSDNVSVFHNILTDSGFGIYLDEGCADIEVTSNDFTENDVQLVDDSPTLDIGQVLVNNTFDRSVVIDRPGASLLYVILSSIQDAIDGAIPNDTIIVGTGNYTEAISIATDNLTVLGAQVGVDPTAEGARTDESAESIIDVSGIADNETAVLIAGGGLRGTFDGFTVTGAVHPAIVIVGGYNYRLFNNIITDSGFGIMVEDCTGDSNPGALLVRNVVKDVTGAEMSSEFAFGIFVLGSDVIIGGSTIDGSVDGVAPGYPGIGILAVGDSTAVIRASSIINWMGEGTLDGMEVGSNGIRIGMGTWEPEVLGHPSSANITFCSVEDNLVGIVVDKEGDASIHFNNILNNEIGGVYRISPNGGQINAAKNWWGDASGPDGPTVKADGRPTGLLPGIGDNVSANVWCTPWLTRPFETVVEDAIAYFGISSHVKKGWNIVSTPLALDVHVTANGDAANTWGGLLNLGKKAEGDDYALKLHDTSPIWYYDSDPESENFGWRQVISTTEVNPVEAYYVRMKETDRIPILWSPDFSVPSKELYEGWNLVGFAYMSLAAAEAGEASEDLTVALATIEEVSSTAGDVKGYAQVVSPPVNQTPWIFIPGPEGEDGTYIPDEAGLGKMQIGKGYWVFMANPGTLAGLTFTPISPKIPPMLHP